MYITLRIMQYYYNDIFTNTNFRAVVIIECGWLSIFFFFFFIDVH